MNILFFTYGHVSKMRGGIDRVTDTLALSLMRRGHKISMISVCPPWGGDSLAPYQYVLPHNNPQQEENERYVTDFICHNQVDLIVNQSERLAILQLIHRAKGKVSLISVNHTDPLALTKGVRDDWDYWRISEPGWKFWLRSPYYLLRSVVRYRLRWQATVGHHREMSQLSDAVVLLSSRFKSNFLKIVGEEYASRLFAIPNPFSYQVKEGGAKSPKEKMVLFVSRLDFSPKRLDRVLTAWHKLDKQFEDWRLVVIGDGVAADLFKDYAARLSLKNVEFTGQANPMPYYQKASILCVSSTHEGFSLVLTEGLQQEVIPIAFDSYESVRDIITHGKNGFLVPPFSVKGYARTLQTLMQDENLRERMRRQIREDQSFLHQFDVERITDEWEQLFRKLTWNK
jgi:glycosyltransferase involved in cell wall biosynthesis